MLECPKVHFVAFRFISILKSEYLLHILDKNKVKIHNHQNLLNNIVFSIGFPHEILTILYLDENSSPVAISITWKMVPHEILLCFPVHWAMLVQKLHDATLASLSVLKKSRWRPRWSP